MRSNSSVKRALWRDPVILMSFRLWEPRMRGSSRIWVINPNVIPRGLSNSLKPLTVTGPGVEYETYLSQLGRA